MQCTPPPQTKCADNNQMADIPESGIEPDSFVSEESLRGESLSSSLILTHPHSLRLRVKSFGLPKCWHLTVGNLIWIYFAALFLNRKCKCGGKKSLL